ncbi:hypothetical protein [Lysobacter tyrosinilyticus]
MVRSNAGSARSGSKTLSHVIRFSKPTLVATTNQYQQNVATVTQLMTSIFSSNLPTLNQNPPDWDQFVTAYTQGKTVALSWTNTVMARLLTVPQDVQGYNPTITAALQDAQAQATLLVQNPQNQIALGALNTDLATVSRTLNLVVTFIAGAVSAIQNFNNTMPSLASNLQSIADSSAQAAQADMTKINTLKADIAKLESDISSLTAAIIGLGIADGAAITLGTIATIAAWPIGALTWIVLGPAVAVATTYIALDAIQIKADKDKIAADQSAITGLTADVATLQILAQQYTQFAQATQALGPTLLAILQEWQTLETEVNAAIADVQHATQDASSASFTKVQQDLAQALHEWQLAYGQAGTLVLNVQANNAQLQYGMSQAQVQSALASGTSVDVVTYCNQRAA